MSIDLVINQPEAYSEPRKTSKMKFFKWVPNALVYNLVIFNTTQYPKQPFAISTFHPNSRSLSKDAINDNNPPWL